MITDDTIYKVCMIVSELSCLAILLFGLFIALEIVLILWFTWIGGYVSLYLTSAVIISIMVVINRTYPKLRNNTIGYDNEN